MHVTVSACGKYCHWKTYECNAILIISLMESILHFYLFYWQEWLLTNSNLVCIFCQCSCLSKLIGARRSLRTVWQGREISVGSGLSFRHSGLPPLHGNPSTCECTLYSQLPALLPASPTLRFIGAPHQL